MSQNTDWKKKTNDIFKLLNEYRRNPRILADHLKGLKKYLDKNKVLSEPNKIPIQMVEGEIVIDEAVKFLNSLRTLPPFELDPALCESAQEHVDDIGPKGLLSYQSSDGTEPEERISKYGEYKEALGENIDFGPNDAMGVLISLTLDDGEDERPHRDNLFKSDYRKIGIACGPHKTEYQMCVMDFAFDFIPHKKPETLSNSNTNMNMNNSRAKANEVNKQPLIIPQSYDKVEKQQTAKTNNSYIEKESFKNETDFKHQSKYEQKVTEKEKEPVVKVNIDQDYQQNYHHTGSVNEISKINSSKKIVSKYVEVITKTIITYEDGAKKEVVEKEEHTFNY